MLGDFSVELTMFPKSGDEQRNGLLRWAELQIPDTDFDIAALHSAIDEQRTRRKLSWKAVAIEVNHTGTLCHPPDQPVHDQRLEE